METEDDLKNLETGDDFEKNFAENEYEKRGSIPVRK
jgi:hypothetical protein